MGLKDLFQRSELMRIPQLVIGGILLILSRIGSKILLPEDILTKENYIWTWYTTADPGKMDLQQNVNILGFFLTYALFFNTLVNVIGLLAGDRSGRVKDLTVAIVGFLGFVTVSGMSIHNVMEIDDLYWPVKYYNFAAQKAMGSLGIILSGTYLLELILRIVNRDSI